MPRRLLVVRERLHDDEILARDDARGMRVDVPDVGARQHLLVEVDVALHLEEEIDEHAVLDRLEEPVRVDLVRVEPGVAERGERGRASCGVTRMSMSPLARGRPSAADASPPITT
jgi:hypothetical protein